MNKLSSQLGWRPLPWYNVTANVTAASGKNFKLQPPVLHKFMDAGMQHQWLNTEEESVWVLYREIMLQNFTGIASIPGINEQGKGDLVGTV